MRCDHFKSLFDPGNSYPDQENLDITHKLTARQNIKKCEKLSKRNKSGVEGTEFQLFGQGFSHYQ